MPGKTASYLQWKAVRRLPGSTANVIDPTFFNQVAQFAHFGMMFSITTFCSAVGYRLGKHYHWPHLWYGMAVGGAIDLLYGIWHEFFWDPTHENTATRGSDLQDFFFLELGNIVGAAVFYFLVM